MKFLKKIFRHRDTKNFFLQKGSFLVDVMMSLTVVMMGIAAGYTLLSQAILGHRINKNKIIAINIAREGMEAVRLIRDTNWLKYGSNKRVCWNFMKDTDENGKWDPDVDDSCTENLSTGQNIHPIGLAADGEKIKSYIALLDDINYDWTLVENFYKIVDQPAADITQNTRTCAISTLVSHEDCSLDITDGIDWAARMDVIEGGVGSLSSQLYIDANNGLYTHVSTGGNSITNFYREIFIEYPSSDNNGFFPEDKKDLDNQLLITVKVWYPSAPGVYGRVIMETELTDYLERTNWND